MNDKYEYLDRDGLPVTEYELLGRFDDVLDFDGLVSVAGLEYAPSRVLKEVDPIAYRESFLNWINYELEEGNITEPE